MSSRYPPPLEPHLPVARCLLAGRCARYATVPTRGGPRRHPNRLPRLLMPSSQRREAIPDLAILLFLQQIATRACRKGCECAIHLCDYPPPTLPAPASALVSTAL